MKATIAAMGLAALVGSAVLGGLRVRRRVQLRGKVAIVCGGSRGLGRSMAMELARRGCDVGLCARTATDLEATKSELERFGVSVVAASCDLRQPNDVAAFVSLVEEELGPADILVANAATMTVGPIEDMTFSDFDEAIDSIFKTALHASMAVLPGMRARRSGTIAFVTSIGGKFGVPHLAPYSSAKFAEIGYSEALRAEVAKDGVNVLTVIPGLMRTGSHVRALFKGNPEMEYAWFGAAATAPLLTIDAGRAARRIVRAIEQGREELVFTLPARVARRTHDWFPSIWRTASALASRLLPRATPEGEYRAAEGRWVELASTSSLVALVRRRSAPLAAKHAQ